MLNLSTSETLWESSSIYNPEIFKCKVIVWGTKYNLTHMLSQRVTLSFDLRKHQPIIILFCLYSSLNFQFFSK